MPGTAPATDALLRTPLHALHRELGAKMVPFAGYDMPVQYPDGILKEHLHCRASAGLFDVSHMGQARIDGAGAVAAFEALVPGDIAALAPGRMRYTMFTDDSAGILDDLMVAAREDGGLVVVLNAACKADDMAHLEAGLTGGARATLMDDRALLALQGPKAADVMARFAPGAEGMKFMSAAEMAIAGIDCFVSRSGYTGEDGYEISVAASGAEALARRLLAEPEVVPIGLGARDTLRLEAGLCLYGHDIDTTTTPVEAGLAWTISKRRRAEGGFPGAARIQRELAEGPARKRVGIRPEGRAPARDGTAVSDSAGHAVGTITSGGFSPSLGAPVAMGYVASSAAAPGTALALDVRGRALAARVADLPFVPHRYHKG
ncbi:MAG: glycine cleavage system aminomethyltransferase GcvT [Alphaproteobacteria bacterium]|nr:glycine cleavage system aminomethyltransferase GcvT [Alphaproteobacteria bacterium]